MNGDDQSIAVGDWRFHPASGELRRNDEVRRIEPRAARALEILLDAEGALVTQEQFVEQVWGGRSLSDNSVSVVIGQLRRAIDDDPRDPRILETIPKRGYRLKLGRMDGAAPAPARTARPWVAIAAIVAIVAIIAAAAWAWSARQAGQAPVIAVGEVANETGETRYAPLARATGELILNELGERGFKVRRGGLADLSLQSKLIIWDEKPFVSLSATDREGAVVWSAMLDASPDRVPPGVDSALDELQGRLRSADGAARLAKPGPAR